MAARPAVRRADGLMWSRRRRPKEALVRSSTLARAWRGGPTTCGARPRIASSSQIWRSRRPTDTASRALLIPMRRRLWRSTRGLFRRERSQSTRRQRGWTICCTSSRRRRVSRETVCGVGSAGDTLRVPKCTLHRLSPFLTRKGDSLPAVDGRRKSASPLVQSASRSPTSPAPLPSSCAA